MEHWNHKTKARLGGPQCQPSQTTKATVWTVMFPPRQRCGGPHAVGPISLALKMLISLRTSINISAAASWCWWNQAAHMQIITNLANANKKRVNERV